MCCSLQRAGSLPASRLAAAGRRLAAPSAARLPSAPRSSRMRRTLSRGQARQSTVRRPTAPAMHAAPGRDLSRSASRNRQAADCPGSRALRRRPKVRRHTVSTTVAAEGPRRPRACRPWERAARPTTAPAARTRPGTRTDWWRGPSRDRRREAGSDRGAPGTARFPGGSATRRRSARDISRRTASRPGWRSMPPRRAGRASAPTSISRSSRSRLFPDSPDRRARAREAATASRRAPNGHPDFVLRRVASGRSRCDAHRRRAGRR